MPTTLDNLIAGIADGQYDDALPRLQEAMNLRREHQKRMTMLGITKGSVVSFNSQTKPRYLIGKRGVVTKKNSKTVVVDLFERVTSPQGRSWHRNIRVPVGLVNVEEA